MKKHEVLKDTLQFAIRLEVNGKPFIEAYGAYKEQEKQQLAAEEAKKQQKPEMTKVKGQATTFPQPSNPANCSQPLYFGIQFILIERSRHYNY